ncbi:LPS export ABC transporter permease LptG [Glaciecola sp. MH2013]|uniref:LPS export ABC transporter permease LptG n=1 Tax=Glaciecola sp. MH2013 TaxID=2785524 RepID=UPI00189C736E|nr:LPS export ABC transporter permease LptG [Glaciecola sp. MH2013]MBF7074954.1 LPS export ABC transporter permease LptG [Glaciecola sp. MH2013]
MFKLLDLYVARTLLSTVTVTLSVLIGLSALIKFVEQLRRVGQGDYDMTLAALYVLLSLPREIEQFLPMATLLGGLIGMGLLAQNSELVVMQSAGLSRWNIINSAMKSLIILIVAVMLLGEFVTPKSESKAKELRTQALSGGSLILSDELFWAKDGNDFVSISEVLTKESLRNITIYKFDENLELNSIISAEAAMFKNDSWMLQQVSSLSFSETQIDKYETGNLEWNSTLTPDKLGIVAIKPEALSIRGLISYVNYLENSDQDAEKYRLAFWRKVLQPLSVAVMLLMALSFIFGPLRSVTMGARTIMGVMVGFSFFIANQVFGQFSLVFQLPAIVGATLPSIAFAFIAILLLRRQ